MTVIQTLFQSLVLPHNTYEHTDLSADLERLELLLPEVAHLVSRSPQEYALAYAERYQGDISSLEHEWEFLAAAQLQAWQQEEYEVVVRLTAALAYPAGRRANLAEAEQTLQLGIEACRHISDTRHLASFLNRLSALAIARGQYHQGQQLWYTSLQLAKSASAFPILWEPFASFAHSADILGNYGAARQFVELLQETHQAEDPESFVVALFIRGLFAYFIHDLDRACEDLSACLRLLLASTSDTPSSPFRQLFSVVVQAEFARAQGQYARAQAYTKTALALAQVYGDHYTFGTLLIDQGIFTYQQSQFADMRVAFLCLRELAQRMETPHFLERSRFFEQCLIENTSAPPAPQRLSAVLSTPTNVYEPLSAREEEVLRLVAEGLPSREIARQLVITPGTVKKHLEHIYTKLDAHSRTSALARARTLKMIS